MQISVASSDESTPEFPWRSSWESEFDQPGCATLVAEADDPFDDFDEDDFDDDFDDDFEEDWEDDLTEDDEFPDTFGGAEEDAEESGDEASPFSDDPDFDED